MKDFNQFRKIMSSPDITNSLHEKMDSFCDSDEAATNPIVYMEHYVGLAVMTALEQYHSWLHGEG